MHLVLDIPASHIPLFIDQALADWTVTKHSKRCLELNGRPLNLTDICRIWVAAGHVFLFDLDNEKEIYNSRKSSNRKLLRVKMEQLDHHTRQLIKNLNNAASQSLVAWS